MNSILFTAGDSSVRTCKPLWVCDWDCQALACLTRLSLGVWARGLQAHTQIAVHNFAVVNLSSHGTNLLQLVFLGFNSFFQFLKFFIFRNRLLLAALLLL